MLCSHNSGLLMGQLCTYSKEYRLSYRERPYSMLMVSSPRQIPQWKDKVDIWNRGHWKALARSLKHLIYAPMRRDLSLYTFPQSSYQLLTVTPIPHRSLIAYLEITVMKVISLTRPIRCLPRLIRKYQHVLHLLPDQAHKLSPCLSVVAACSCARFLLTTSSWITSNCGVAV